MIQRPSFSLYNASAGSGKTYTLVKEYLKIILTAKRQDAYRNILAITFTNKAVHEMKSRIVNSLSEFTKDAPGAKTLDFMNHISAETGMSIAAIRQKSREIIKHLIHNYAAFDISTIDKFTHKVIRAFAHDLKLSLNFEVSLDTENLLAEAVDALIAQAGDDEVLTKLLIDFTMEKTDDDKSWDVTREILDAGRLLLNENNRQEVSHIQKTLLSEFGPIKERLLEKVKCFEDDCVECVEQAFALLDKNAIDHSSFSGKYFPNHLQSIRDRKYNPANKRYYSSEDIKINKGAADRAVIEAIVPELLEILEKVYSTHSQRDFCSAFLKNITPLSLLGTVNNELTKIQEEQNVLSIAEFNKLINDEIQNQPAPFIYERIGERYKHFFIDEFQDTSEMQWQNLIPLINNATSSEDPELGKGTLMIVGDPKQSIYRWRGGKAEQFIALSNCENPFNNPDKEVFTLGTNFRSYSQIISFNNDFFKLLSNEFTHPDYKELYENHSHQEQTGKTGGYVNISFIDENGLANGAEKVQAFAEATAETVREALAKGFSYRDIAVLTRKRHHGVAVAQQLTAEGIPIISSETLLLDNSAEVRFLLNFLRYLKNNADVESKANMLIYLAPVVAPQLPLHDFVEQGHLKFIESDFEAWLRLMDIQISFADLRKKSLYETIESILRMFIHEDRSNAYIQHFLDIILERDIKNMSGISDFLEFWDKNAAKISIPSPEDSDAVRILTIHKSKGLEFPVVIFPFAEEDYAKKPKDKLWIEAESEIFGLPKVLIDNSKAVEEFGEIASAIYLQKKQEELLDNINVLYVALTRAEEQLYVISAMNLKKSGERPDNCLSAFLIKYLESVHRFDSSVRKYEFGDPKRVSSESEPVAPMPEIQLVKQPMDLRQAKIARKESLMWNTTQQKAIEYGNVIHEVMAHIHVASDLDKAITLAVEDGLISSSEVADVTLVVNQIVSHPELFSYFNGDIKVLNEQLIIRKGSTPVKPDRMVLASNNEILLLDYKTGDHKSSHVLQLASYQHAIEEMGFVVSKKALIYIGDELKIVNL
ncbi:MAG TPA: UvrD-helicase domain-containing protein [Flavobacterium sp.]|jgi:ATP-dependent exoDNAse (exonuclease V) beta subunit